MEETRTAGRAIVDVLRAEGVRNVFGLPGGHVISQRALQANEGGTPAVLDAGQTVS
ncbi:MAG TPA: thiamine pyrophosphate-binding protein [Solirubrobacteraceae bacterium]|nr:thiamine pyrophosphate-binding protein [Solirubrobacteraceae bacterium]